jgi:hypothetical protein
MKAFQTRVLAALSSAVLLCGLGCANELGMTVPPYDYRKPHPFPEELPRIRNELETVSVSDGVSRDEANRLAVAYWRRFCSRCGLVEPVRDAGEHWKAQVVTGFIAQRDGKLLIHKTTGEISWKGSHWKNTPVITDWSQLWQ